MNLRKVKPRVRCAECGSTRVRGVVLGYCDGPVRVDERGRAFVDTGSGAWEEHEDTAIEGGSVVCQNCGAGRFRIEGAKSA